jgi:hypothetical protein
MVDELHQVDRAPALQLDLVQLFRIEHHIFVLLDLEAFHDVLGFHRANAGRHLLIADALARRLVDLVQRRVLAAVHGGEELNPDGDEREPQIALPVGARGHGSALSCVDSQE